MRTAFLMTWITQTGERMPKKKTGKGDKKLWRDIYLLQNL